MFQAAFTDLHRFHRRLHRGDHRIYIDRCIRTDHTSRRIDYILSHIKDRHSNREGIGNHPDRHPHLEKVFKKHPGIDLMHVILFRQHGNQLIAQHKRDDHPRNGDNHRV